MTEPSPQELFDLRLAHVGINATSEVEAKTIAERFCTLFNLDLRATPISYFADPAVEVMCHGGRGACGHLGFHVNSVEDAMTYFEARGFAFAPESLIYTEDGRVRLVYFAEQLGGFAIHLTIE